MGVAVVLLHTMFSTFVGVLPMQRGKPHARLKQTETLSFVESQAWDW